MNRSFILLLLPLLTLPAWSQVAPVAAPAAVAPVMNDAVQGGWQAVALELNAGQWQRMMSEGNVDGLVQLNGLRSDRNAVMARNQGAIPAGDADRLRSAAQELERTAPGSFEAHMAGFYVAFPAPSAYVRLEQARARAPERIELLGPLLANAARTGQASELTRRSRDLMERGAVATGLLRMADDILLSLDTDAVLFAAGEMDAYPLWVRQYVDGERPDVLVVDVRLLADPGYRQRVWVTASAKGTPPNSTKTFIEQLALATARPVHLSMALGALQADVLRDRLQVTGMAFRYNKVPQSNIPALEQRWAAMHKTIEAGPLSRNYLVAGSVLLKYYRSVGNESGAAQMEHELRSLARQMGATDLLYRIGLLEH